MPALRSKFSTDNNDALVVVDMKPDKKATAPVISHAALVAYHRSHRMKAMKNYRDENGHIKRPPNSYMLFRSAFIGALQDMIQKTSVTHGYSDAVTSKVWRELNSAEKAIWKAFQKDEKQAHKVAHPDYKYTPEQPQRVNRARWKVGQTLSASLHPTRSAETKAPQTRSSGITQNLVQSLDCHTPEVASTNFSPTPNYFMPPSQASPTYQVPIDDRSCYYAQPATYTAYQPTVYNPAFDPNGMDASALFPAALSHSGEGNHSPQSWSSVTDDNSPLSSPDFLHQWPSLPPAYSLPDHADPFTLSWFGYACGE